MPARSDEVASDGAEVRQAPRHFHGFDGLRAIAALTVLLVHTAWSSGLTLHSGLGIYTSRLEIGVSVFFLISGFLLYRPFVVSHLSDQPDPSLGKFWIRRLMRIVPAYWLALTVLGVVFRVITLGPGWKGVLGHYLFLQIYFPNLLATGIVQAWSLCTEMTFYLFLPLYAMAIATRRRSPETQLRRELLGVAVLILASFAFRWWALNLSVVTVRHGHAVAICAPNCATNPPYQAILTSWLPAYLDLFALGMLLAVVSAWFAARRIEPGWLSHPLMPWLSWILAALTFVAVSHIGIPRAIIYFVTPGLNVARQTLYGLFAFFLLLPAVFGASRRGLIRRFLSSWPMASIGVISYSIYLWHVGMIDQFLKWTRYEAFSVPFWVLTLAVLAMSVAVSSASYFLLERPILRLKNGIGWWDRRRSDVRRLASGSNEAAPLPASDAVARP
jgi:peptidoglycan/LPS O-acetylase OafA/YrhL